VEGFREIFTLIFYILTIIPFLSTEIYKYNIIHDKISTFFWSSVFSSLIIIIMIILNIDSGTTSSYSMAGAL